MNNTLETDKAIAAIANALAAKQLTINSLDDGTSVVLDIKSEQMLTMNTSGTAIVQAIENGASSLTELSTLLTQRFEVSHARASNDARSFVESVAKLL